MRSVNANRRHYAAAEALACADRDWLTGLVSRRSRSSASPEAFSRQPDDIKVVIMLNEGAE